MRLDLVLEDLKGYEIVALCKDFLRPHNDFGMSLKNMYGNEIANCKDFLAHSMILDLVAETCGNTKM